MTKTLQARTSCVFALAALFCLYGTPPASGATVGSAQAGDRIFITDLLQQSRGQLALATLARQRATNPVVSSAATQSAREWTAIRGRLATLAYARAALLRGALDVQQQRELDWLGRTQANRFGVEYLRLDRNADGRALWLMSKEAGTLDPRIQRFLRFARPALTADEQMASDDVIGYGHTS